MKISVPIIRRYLKPAVFLALSWPLAWLVWQWGQFIHGQPNGLGFNPQEFTNRYTGDWALRYILGGLAITPLARLTHTPTLVHFRRMAGLFAFAYASVHLTSYIALDQIFNWTEIWNDILKRTFITLGMTAFTLLIPLAVTSTNKMVKRVGAKRWLWIHRMIYPISILVLIHFIMMRKGTQLEPLVYGAILTVLLSYRLAVYFKKKAGFRRTRHKST